MPGWTPYAVNQRDRFVETSRSRIADALRELQSLRSNLWQTSSLRSVARLCHQLAGSSGFFDMPTFSRTASKSERVALDLLTKSSDLTLADIDLLTSELSTLTSVLDAAVAADTPDCTPTAIEALPDNLMILCADPRLSIKLTADFEALNYSIRHFRTTDSATEHLSGQDISALIIVTPVADKPVVELIAEFRKQHVSKPVILLSQHDDFLDRLAIIKIGIDGYFEAPFDTEAIALRLKELSNRESIFHYRVLSVEDDPIQSEMIANTLQAAGYAVVSLQSHFGFEEAIISFNPDLILLDVDLGDVTGFDLARYVRKIDRLSTIPIMFLTTKSQLDSFEEGARAGGDEYLVKPASTQYLVATITARIERYRAMQRLLERDGLTRFYNYSNFLLRSQQATASESTDRIWMVTFDVDRLGEINSTLGLASGDRAIAAAAKIIRSVFRHTDLIGRTAGGEFSILVKDMDELLIGESCKVVLKQAMESELFPHSTGIQLTVSAGFAPLAAKSCVEEGLKRSRSALKVAKKSGRASVVKLPEELPLSH